jgi:hypothetical protein
MEFSCELRCDLVQPGGRNLVEHPIGAPALDRRVSAPGDPPKRQTIESGLPSGWAAWDHSWK